MNYMEKRDDYLDNYFNFNNFYKTTNYMKTDIYERDNKFFLEIDLPGFKKEDIKINYENNYLTITAIKDEKRSTKDKYVRRERVFGELKRIFYIGEKKQNEIRATYSNGILYISFPKLDSMKKTSKNIIIE